MSDTMAFVEFEPLSVSELFISVLIEGTVALESAGRGSSHFSADVYCGQTVAHLSYTAEPCCRIERQRFEFWRMTHRTFPAFCYTLIEQSSFRILHEQSRGEQLL